MHPKRAMSGGVECAKYGLLTFALVLGPTALHTVAVTPHALAGYLELGGGGLCLWLVDAVERGRAPWVRPLRLHRHRKARADTEPSLPGGTED